MLSKYRSRYHVYQIFLFDWEYKFRKRKKESCHPIQSISFSQIFADLLGGFLLALSSSESSTICLTVKYYRYTKCFFFIYPFRFINDVFGFFNVPSLFLCNGSESFFWTQLQFHHLWMSVSNSNRKNFDIRSNILDFEKLFYLRSMNSTLTWGNFQIWNVPKFSWEYHRNQVQSRTCKNVQTENDRIRTRSRSVAKTYKSMMKCNHKFRVWTIMIDGWRKWLLKNIIWS